MAFPKHRLPQPKRLATRGRALYNAERRRTNEKKIKDIINLDAHAAAIEKYSLTVKHISSVEIEFHFSNGNWINIWYREKGAAEGDKVIYFDSNIEAYGLTEFKHPWQLGEDIDKKYFSKLISNKITPSKQKCFLLQFR